MALRFKIQRGNFKKLEGAIRSGGQGLSKELKIVIKKDMNKWAKGLIKAVQSDPRFTELTSDPDLRGKLGMPKQSFRKGSDTDAEDLIKLLNTFRITETRSGRARTLKVLFPSIDKLEENLTRNLSKIRGGKVTSGPTQSWFRWWEFGDRGEITSLTVLRKTISKIASRSGRGINRARLNNLITNRSRSGSAVQLRLPKSAGGGIAGRGLISNKYRNFRKIFPARIGKVVKGFVRSNNVRIAKLFTTTRAL